MKGRLSFAGSRKGSAMVVMAAAMTVILAFGALVVDIGSVMLERQKLQNAVDAACLAAAMELPDTAKAKNIAREYAQANGVDPDDITVTFSDSNRTVDVKANKTVDFFLARVMGFESTDTAAVAAATLDHIGGAFNYTIFSGSTTEKLGIYGSNINITGSSHANCNFDSSASNLKITGACEAVTTVTVNGSNINVRDRRPNSPVVEMPDFSQILKQQAIAAGQYYNGDRVFSGSSVNLDAPIYVNGNVTIATSNFKGKGCIVATGNITISASNLNASADSAVCIYSTNGDILLSASNVVIDGIYYAPNGKIGSYASDITVHGKVIGKTVAFSASNLNIVDSDAMLSSLPSQGIKLIR